MATWAIMWIDGHVETIKAERYDFFDGDATFIFHDGDVREPVASVPNAGIRVIRRASEQKADMAMRIHRAPSESELAEIQNANRFTIGGRG
ncbi:hypothetical protein ABZ234_03665 [Nocardiopsis sp. NPDC006198]|uniref:hypothetical protein n=1 Tax=Nocardiopsis sp. NPDC006198 TaxID=3154472 RepID=UPI0033BE72CA